MSKLMRVSQVLSLFTNLWKVPQEVLARKADIGTNIHEAIFNYLFNTSRKVEVESQELLPYVQSFHEWVKTKDFSIVHWEERVICGELGLTGQPDAVLRMGNESYLFDWKTSAKDDPVSWRLQGTAYIELLRRAGREVSDTFYFLKLRKDGKKADTFVYKYTDENWHIFLKALDCARYFEKWKGPLEE